MPILAINQVSKRVKKKTILSEISFELEKGTVTGLIGHNGAGKSTTFKAIMGLIRPTQGSITLFDRAASDYRSHEKIGYLPENPIFPDYLSGYEFLAYMADITGVSAHEKKTRIATLLEQMGLHHHEKKMIKFYSKGMKQKLGIAQALLAEPELLIMDEPLSGLDPIGRHEIQSILAKLKNDGKTVLLSSHILYDLEQVCNRYIMISQGKIIGDIPASATHDIETLYLDKIGYIKN